MARLRLKLYIPAANGFPSTNETLWTIMKTRLTFAAALLALALGTSAAESSSSLDAVQGKWSSTKTNRDGQRYAQILEIKKDRLTFQVLDDNKEVRFVAKGSVKSEAAGPFKLLVVSNIEAGRSADDLRSVDESRSHVYTFRDGQLVLASNFDHEREKERPEVSFYVRVEDSKTAAGGPDNEIKLLGSWKMTLTISDRELDYGLRVARTDGQLAATLISPRSGEHKAKSTVWKEGELVIEVNREYEGNTVTIVYKGKLTDDGLSGTFAGKGFEDQFNGTWKARK
jgi:hypothetical protein